MAVIRDGRTNFSELQADLAAGNQDRLVLKARGADSNLFYQGAARETTDPDEILIHPDGEHGKRFDFAGWLPSRGSTELPGPERPAMPAGRC